MELTGDATPLEGDAAVHLEELVVDELPGFAFGTDRAAAVAVELVGPHLRLSGSISTGQHRRLSDFLNHQDGLLRVDDVTILRRNGDPTRVTAPSMWANPAEVTLVAATGSLPGGSEATSDLRVMKSVYGVVVVTSGHTLTGDVHIPPAAELSRFIESPDPPFIPMTDVRTRSLADRRIIARYAFALLNRRHVIAAAALQPGMIRGQRVL